MHRWAKWGVVGVVVVALGSGLHLAMGRISTDRLRPRVEDNLTRSLGQEVTIEELALALLPTPHLRAEGVRIANAPGRASADWLSIDRLELGVSFWPLLRRIAAIDELRIAGAELHLELGAERGGAPMTSWGGPTGDDDEDAVRLEVRRLRVEDLRIFVRERPEGPDRLLAVDAFVLDSEGPDHPISIEARGRYQGSDITLSGQTGSYHELMKSTQPFPIDLEGQLLEAHVTAKGTLLEPLKLEGVAIDLAAEIPHLVVAEEKLTQFGTLRFEGHLSDLDATLGLEGLNLETSQSADVRVGLEGRIDDLVAMKGIEITGDLQGGPLGFLTPFIQPHVAFPIPEISDVRIQAKLFDEAGLLTLAAKLHAATAGEALVLSGDATIRDVRDVAELDATLALQATHLTAVTSLIPDFPKHGPLGPLTVSARLRGDRAALGASDLRARLGRRDEAWVEIDGRVGDLVTLRGVDLTLNFGAESLHHLEQLLEREIPPTQRIEGHASLSDADGTLGLEHLGLHSQGEGPIDLHVEAKVDDLRKLGETEIELVLNGQDARVLGALAGVDVPSIRPLEFSGRIQGSQEQFKVEAMKLRLAGSDLAGSLEGSFAPKQRPSLSARLESKTLRLQDLGVVPSEAPSGSGTTSSAAWTWPAGDLKLPFERLRHVDVDVSLRVDRLIGSAGLDADTLRLSMLLRDGNLVVRETGARFKDGHLSLDLRIDARTPVPDIEVEFLARQVDLARVVAQFREDTHYSGIVDVYIDLEATGPTLDALRRSITGTVSLSNLHGNVASRIGRQFIVNLSEIAFPLLKVTHTPALGCGIVAVEIAKGIARVERLLLKEKEISARATGTIDLVQGLYDLRVVPKSSNPGILSFTPEVLVSGPLDDPVFRPVKLTLLTSLGEGAVKTLMHRAGYLIQPFRARSKGTDVIDAECQIQLPSKTADEHAHSQAGIGR